MPATVEAVRAPDWRRTLVLALAVVAMLHSAVIALWLAPSGPVRQSVGSGELAAYVDPYFRQSWDTLQPSSQRVDETFRVRARVRDGSTDLVTTDWEDVTARQAAAVPYDFNPSRSSVASRRLATNLNSAMLSLGGLGRSLVADNYVVQSVSLLGGELADGKVDEDAIRTYMVNDTMATRFASLYAQARWDGDLVEVQFRSGYRRVSPQSRDETEIRETDFTWFDVGWRRAYRGPTGARTSFREWVGP